MLGYILFMTAIGGFIGWTTNVIAVKLLFRPLKPVKFPFVSYTLQGLIPKRQAEIARSIGEVVESELISVEDIIDKMIESEDKSELVAAAKKRILELAETNMPAMVPSMFRGMIMKYVEDAIDQNADQIMNELSEKLIHKATEKVDIAQMVEEKIIEFDLIKLEEIILSISKNELKHIEWLGGILGILIGLVQALVVVSMK